MTNRDGYVAKMKQQLDDLNAKMTELESKANDAKAEAREAYKEEMKKLRQHSKAAIAKLDELRTAGESSWEKMIAEMEKVRDAFTHSVRYFKSQIKD